MAQRFRAQTRPQNQADAGIRPADVLQALAAAAAAMDFPKASAQAVAVGDLVYGLAAGGQPLTALNSQLQRFLRDLVEARIQLGDACDEAFLVVFGRFPALKCFQWLDVSCFWIILGLWQAVLGLVGAESRRGRALWAAWWHAART